MLPGDDAPTADRRGNETATDTGPAHDDFRPTGLEQSMGAYLPATAAFRLINFGRILLLTWCMAEKQMGLLNLLLMIVNVMIPLFSFGLNEAVARYAPMYEERGALAAFFRRSLQIVTLFTLAACALLALFADRVGAFLFGDSPADPVVQMTLQSDARSLTVAAAVVIALSVWYFYMLAILKGLRMFRVLSRLEVSHAVLFLLGAVVMILLKKLSALVLTAIFGLSILLPVAYYGLRLSRTLHAWPRQLSPLGETHFASKLLRFSIWTALSGVTWQLLQGYATWYLNRTHGEFPVAVFSTVQKIAQLVLIGAVAVSTVAMTTVSKTWESRGSDAAERQLSLAFRGTGIALFFVCAILALGKDFVMRIFPASYAPGGETMPLQLLFTLLAAYLSFLPAHFNLREKTSHAFLSWAIGIGLNALLAFWLTRPGTESIVKSELWKSMESGALLIFAPAFFDLMGLHGAAWCAAIAMIVATAVCTMLVRAEGGRLDRGSYLVLAASLLLATRPVILAAGTVLILICVVRTELVFSAEERRRLLGYGLESLRHIPLMPKRGRDNSK